MGHYMLNIRNCGPETFKKILQKKEVFIYGAGRTLESNIKNYFQNIHVIGIIDKDPRKWGKKSFDEIGEFSICGIDVLIEYIQRKGLDNILLYITSQFYAAEIIEELDKIPELDKLECYIHFLIRNTREKLYDFDFTVGEQLIPKKIHYVWFGGKDLPQEYIDNIDTWKKYNPDYEIVRWDESNYDVEKTDFTREAYKAGKWSHLSNYVRLEVIYENGGIYLDTDVEVIKNFDCILNDECFFCMGNQDSINNGCGFGAISGNSIVYSMMNEYSGLHYDPAKGGVGMRSGHNFLDPVLKENGFVMENKYQKINGTVLYPKEIFAPLTFSTMEDFYCEKTISVHKEAGAWKSGKEKEGVTRLEEIVRNRLN